MTQAPLPLTTLNPTDLYNRVEVAKAVVRQKRRELAEALERLKALIAECQRHG